MTPSLLYGMNVRRWQLYNMEWM